ncbi:MAG TPA: hypothetical protein VMQ48_02995 [Candidatus Saccharimonadales bacterium]|jgi:hypothetical protein|nr:hypothetical protein [Candidatus Saccharimonadales bacterium]
MSRENIEKLAHNWISAKPDEVDVQSEYYCQTRDVFQTRIDRMLRNLLSVEKIGDNRSYIISAIAGEIGNNSFDHNLGNWRDIPGIFFAYEILGSEVKIALVDRGQGLFATLEKVKPELSDDQEALKTAFLERISGRAPENRGNGLKFVKENVEEMKMHLLFYSGSAQAELNAKMIVQETSEKFEGCLAILSVKLI